jgi:hypothetical protein
MSDTISKIEAAIKAGAGKQDLLDALVDDQASAMASALNNDGLKAQLDFLNTRGWSDENVLHHLEQGDD